MSDDNPWANAAVASKRAQNIPNTPTTQASTSHDPEQAASRRSFWRAVLRSWLILDGIVGISLLLYSILLLKRSHPSTVKTVVALSMTVGILLSLRSAFGLLGLWMPQFRACGNSVSVSYLSPLLAVFLLVLSIICGSIHSKIFHYLENHASTLHLSKGFLAFLDDHSHFLWVSLLVCVGLEAIRWFITRRMVLQQRRQQRNYEVDDDGLGYTTRTPGRRNSRPWWWSKSKSARRQGLQEQLDEPLLVGGSSEHPHWSSEHRNGAYEIRDGALDTTQDSIWSRLRGTLGRTPEPDNARDDGSVDFQSVQEEWASRCEEDPLWWSHEEEATPIRGQGEP